ncbi:hypothetical protein [Bacillus cereus group sp. N24]|uniref:hypothetical protein n=1 Tax=Bacillus cereus group sp. N24 TaxID=2794592 RepID=UPI0018F59312|nr:hypothetical protein [Bacillus cereus group sp. N24]MBJ7950109.1 hypothetical protein [Bacillus cereus group sp. N24]
MNTFKRSLETEEIKNIIHDLYSEESFQETIDTIAKEHDIKLSRYKIEVAESWAIASQKSMKMLILSYCNGQVEMMCAIQDHKKVVTFTLLPQQKMIAA